VLIMAVIADCFILRRTLKKRLTAKFGAPNPGDLWYGVTQGAPVPAAPAPKPQVKRGEYPA
jgi:hypothetical protein